MLGVEARAGFRGARRISDEPRATDGRLRAVPEETRRDGHLVDGDGLEVYEAAVGACGAGEGVGVAPGCDIGVEEVVSSAEGSKWLKMS